MQRCFITGIRISLAGVNSTTLLPDALVLLVPTIMVALCAVAVVLGWVQGDASWVGKYGRRIGLE